MQDKSFVGDSEITALSRLMLLRDTDPESDRVDFFGDILTDAMLAMSSESRELAEFRGKIKAALLNFESECANKDNSKLVASIVDVL
jgi:hypothetical protein